MTWKYQLMKKWRWKERFSRCRCVCTYVAYFAGFFWRYLGATHLPSQTEKEKRVWSSSLSSLWILSLENPPFFVLWRGSEKRPTFDWISCFYLKNKKTYFQPWATWDGRTGKNMKSFSKNASGKKKYLCTCTLYTTVCIFMYILLREGKQTNKIVWCFILSTFFSLGTTHFLNFFTWKCRHNDDSHSRPKNKQIEKLKLKIVCFFSPLFSTIHLLFIKGRK